MPSLSPLRPSQHEKKKKKNVKKIDLFMHVQAQESDEFCVKWTNQSLYLQKWILFNRSNTKNKKERTFNSGKGKVRKQCTYTKKISF